MPYKGKNKTARPKPMKKLADGGKMNQHGVSFTKQEMHDMLSLVEKAAIKRRKQLQEAGKNDFKTEGKPTGVKVAQMQLMGRESDVIIAKRSKSFQRFKSRDEFEKFMGNLRLVNRDDYLNWKMGSYKERYIKALQSVYGNEANDIINKVRNMPYLEYEKWVIQNEEAEIGFPYTKGIGNESPALSKIRLALGMNPFGDGGDFSDWEEVDDEELPY